MQNVFKVNHKNIRTTSKRYYHKISVKKQILQKGHNNRWNNYKKKSLMTLGVSFW